MFSERFEMFRNEQPLHGPARPRRTRRRNVTCTFKVTLLRTGIDRLSSLRGKSFAYNAIHEIVMLIVNKLN